MSWPSEVAIQRHTTSTYFIFPHRFLLYQPPFLSIIKQEVHFVAPAFWTACILAIYSVQHFLILSSSFFLPPSSKRLSITTKKQYLQPQPFRAPVQLHDPSYLYFSLSSHFFFIFHVHFMFLSFSTEISCCKMFYRTSHFTLSFFLSFFLSFLLSLFLSFLVLTYLYLLILSIDG